MITSVQDTFTNSDVASTKALMEDHHGTSSLDRKSTNDEGEIEDEEEREEAKWKKIVKAVAPHLGLLLLSTIYSLIGAAVFISLEEPNSRRHQAERLDQIQKNHTEFISILWNLSSHRRPIEEGEIEFRKFAIKMHGLHKMSKWRSEHTEENMGEWNFNAAIFFVVTTLTTIGYGNVAPVTRGGRIFCILYSIVGIPLLIVTTADVAKFMSSGVNRLYINYLKLKEKVVGILKKLFCRTKPKEVDLQDAEGVAEYLWSNIDSVHYVKVHATPILGIVIAYACLGGLILRWYEDTWSFFDGFYFSMTSVLKVGFGDMLPSNQRYFWLSLLYIFFGLTIATMCVDVIGVEIVRRIHQIGRVAKHADYLNVIQKAKYRKRRREAMRSLMGLLTMLNKIQFPSANLAKKEKEILEELCEMDPPNPPKDVRCTGITPYSMRITWTPPSSPSKTTKYLLSYRMKHSRSESTVNITNISDGEFEIRSLKSFSIYEISVSAMNRVGRSESVRLIQITEPESAPQDLVVELQDQSTVKLRWRPPYKKRKDVRKYAIYYSKNLEDPFEKWYKVCVDASELSLTLEELSDAESYAFCISSVYDRGHSPISRSVYPSNADVSTRATRSTSTQDENANSSLSTSAPPITSVFMDIPL